jgi:glycosyltransferase involved in cell wall biosynthesis
MLPPPDQDPVDQAALSAFHTEYADRPLTPVVLVIAAYNEAKSIAAVVRDVPAEVCGLAVSVVVVDDGSADGTADIARGAGALVCRPSRNRGQGAALRLGYLLARTGGAQYIATSDADGQYEAQELDRIVGPLVSGEADFVSGSRRLGVYETDDAVRHAGVHVFARVVSVLVRARVTDTSNGFRAFRAEIVDDLLLEQPQYQATELLVGVHYRGCRVLEVATTMKQRAAGKSKKGPNLVYGYRFGRVILRTWSRELRRNRSQHRTMSSPPTVDLTGVSGRALEPTSTETSAG